MQRGILLAALLLTLAASGGLNAARVLLTVPIPPSPLAPLVLVALVGVISLCSLGLVGFAIHLAMRHRP